MLLIVCNIVSYFVLKIVLLVVLCELKLLCYDVKSLYGVILVDMCKLFDVCEVIVCIVDDLEFDEFKVCYGMMFVIGFVYIWGYLVGIVVNNGILFFELVVKGVYFIELCC